MSEEHSKTYRSTIQINTTTDKANYALNRLGSVASFLIVAHAAGWLPGLAILLLSRRFITRGYKSGDEKLRAGLAATTTSELPKEAEELPEDIAETAEELGMSKPSFFVSGKKVVGDIYSKYASAEAFGTKASGLILSEALLNLLSDNQRHAVTGHEMGHLKAKHIDRSKYFDTLSVATKLTGTVNYAETVLSSWAGAEAIAVGAAGAFGSYMLLHKLGYNLTNTDHTMKLLNTMSFFNTTGILATSAAQGRYDVLAAWAGAKILTRASNLIALRDRRCCEYQSDRIGAQATGHYEEMATALRKIQRFNRNGGKLPKDLDAYRLSRREKIEDFCDALKEPFSTHPTIAHRCKRLQKLEKRHRKKFPEPISA